MRSTAERLRRVVVSAVAVGVMAVVAVAVPANASARETAAAPTAAVKHVGVTPGKLSTRHANVWEW